MVIALYHFGMCFYSIISLHAITYQVLQSGNPKAEEIVLSNMAVALDRIFMVVKVPMGYVNLSSCL